MNFRRICTHAFLWVAYAVLTVFILYYLNPDYVFHFWDMFFFIANYALVFYGSGLVIFPRFLKSKQYLFCILSLGVLIAIYLGNHYLMAYTFQPFLNPDTPPDLTHSLSSFLITMLDAALPFFVFGYAYWKHGHSLKIEQEKYRLAERNHDLLLRNREVEIQQAQAQLALLKSQIDPHTLYNTLNFLYKKASDVSLEMASAILKLSDMLRYSIKETEVEQVTLQQEIEYIQNYIDLHQLRYRNGLHVDFRLKGSISEVCIIPLVLIPFVENLFKHGYLKDPHEPGQIHLTVENNQFSLMIRNRKGKKSIPSTGLGLSNVKKRLELSYPMTHQLLIEDSLTHYHCQLTIQFASHLTLTPS